MPPEVEPIHFDCRHYRGDKPCRFNRLCRACPHYEPYAQRVCVVKIGALGDVIRTLAILPELRRRYPGAQITWVTAPAAVAFLAGHPQIDRLLPFEPITCMSLQCEAFDLVISLDKEPGPCGLATTIQADRKLGVGLSSVGTPIPLNEEARPYFLLGLSDELKFHRNTCSYPQLLYEALGWFYARQRYELPLDEAAAADVRQDLQRAGWSAGRPTLGVNVGAGRVFANKMWPTSRIDELLERSHRLHPEVQVVLLGGPDEADAMQQLHRALPWTIHGGSDNSAQRFIALVDACDVLLCGDTMAMHVAVARSRGVVAFFGPTCEQEIDLFGLGEKLIAKVPCGPCYKRRCDRGDVCLSAVSVDQALAALGRVMAQRTASNLPVEAVRKAG